MNARRFRHTDGQRFIFLLPKTSPTIKLIEIFRKIPEHFWTSRVARNLKRYKNLTIRYRPSGTEKAQSVAYRRLQFGLSGF